MVNSIVEVLYFLSVLAVMDLVGLPTDVTVYLA
jgi:hypothetical protein